MPVTVLVDPSGAILADSSGALLSGPWFPLTGYTEGFQPFYTVEITAYRPGETTIDFALGHGTRARGALTLDAMPIEVSGTIYASDLGYRTESPVVAYPPLMTQTFDIQARVPLDPGQIGAVWGWGEVRLINAGGRFNDIATTWNSDGRAVTIKRGVKTWDDRRGIWTDPEAADLVTVFSGLAGPWLLDENELVIPLRDPSYWLEKPWARSVYGGTGGYDGDPEIKGKAIPQTRGPVKNVTLIRIDRVNNIWQWSDAAGTISALYEDGAETIPLQSVGGTTTNLYSGSTNAGEYRKDVTRSLIQLGSPTTAVITADVTGEFPTAGNKTNLFDIARYLMTETIGVPAANVATSSFTAAAATYTYDGGVFFGPDDSPTGLDAVMRCLSSAGAKIVPAPDGGLQCFVLRAIPADAVPDAYLTTREIMTLAPRAMPSTVYPPPRRVRVAYQRNYTIQTSGISPSATDDHVDFIGTADRYAPWVSGTVALTWRNAPDLAPLGGALSDAADAEEVAEAVGTLFEPGLRQYDVTVPDAYGIERTFGDIIHITYPFGDLVTGKKTQVVGRSPNPEKGTVTLTVIDG